MATNYTFAQVVQAYADGTNRELMVEIGKRYPLLMAHVSKLIALAGDAFVAFATSMPEHITANKLNKALLESYGDATGEANEDVDEEDTGVDEAADEAGDEDLSSKTTKELYNMCIKKGLKVSKYGKPKSYYIDALTGNGEAEDEADEEDEKPAEKAAKTSKKAAKAEPEDDDDGEEEEDPYAGKSAMELFKECKKRGIKAVPKKPAKHYIELLKKADEEQAAADDGDEWGDEEEAAAPAKTSKKSGSKKAAAKDDDDEDWDI